MSVNAYIDIKVTTDTEHEDEARRWAEENYFTVRVQDDKLVIDGGLDVSYFDGALKEFAGIASGLAIPASDWKADVLYTCEEGACEDGGNISVTIEDGKISSFQESRIVMVDVEPWASFELE